MDLLIEISLPLGNRHDRRRHTKRMRAEFTGAVNVAIDQMIVGNEVTAERILRDVMTGMKAHQPEYRIDLAIAEIFDRSRPPYPPHLRETTTTGINDLLSALATLGNQMAEEMNAAVARAAVRLPGDTVEIAIKPPSPDQHP